MPFNLFGQTTSKSGSLLGCDACPLNKAPGIRKIKGLDRIKGHRVMGWGMCPGDEENRKGLEFVGASGELLWKAFKTIGLSRDDIDIQNIVRCRPTDEQGRNRDPSKREIECCSVYTDRALELNAERAQVHIIFGDVAGLQLLGKKDFKKDKPVFWYPPWNAYVILAWHPSYLVRQGGEKAGWDYETWRDKFHAVRSVLDHPGRWGYIKAQNYKKVMTLSEFDSMEKALRAEQRAERRVSFDIEDGYVDDKKVLIMAGFGSGRYKNSKDWNSWQGQCWSVVLDHPQAGYEPSHLKALQARLVKLIEDGDLKKSLQNGSYDKKSLHQHLGARLRGYEFDTQFGTYLRYSFLRSLRLEDLTYRFFPEFCDYKDVVEYWESNFADAPIDRLVLRNSGDCDITQRLEQKFSPRVNQALVKVYISAGIELDEMETRGPILDWSEWQKAMDIVPKMQAKLDRQLQMISGDVNFNCDSPQQVAWLIYDHLGLTPIEEGNRGTNKTIMDMLIAETKDKHARHTLELVNQRRAVGKVKSTYLESYAACAKENDDEIRTRWALAGAVTGRLRSSGGSNDKRVNLQNIINFPLVQNLLTSDRNWRWALAD